eukprot:237392_1
MSSIALYYPENGVPSRKLSDFEIGEKLGAGGHGEVYAARDKLANENVAIKVIDLAELDTQRKIYRLNNELAIQYHLEHDNCLKLLSYFEESGNLYIILEMAQPLSLHDLIHGMNGSSLSEYEAATYLHPLLEGLSYLRKCSVSHRDIKPKNLLMGMDGKLKISDFGCSVHLFDKIVDDAVVQSSTQSGDLGTLAYLPPEYLTGKRHGVSFDVWSMGVTAFELLIGYVPFNPPNAQNRTIGVEKFATNVAVKDVFVPLSVSEKARRFISKALCRDPKLRPSP